MKLEEVIHLYLGCDIMTPDGQGWLKSISYEPNRKPSNRVSIKFLKMVKTVNSIDGGCDKVRSYGDYLMKAERYEAIASTNGFDSFEMPGGCSLILRPLSDMTADEMSECGNLCYDFSGDPELNKWDVNSFNCLLMPEQFIWLLKRHFDLFDLIESGQAIDATNPPSPIK